MESTIERLIEQGENQQLDFKFSITDTRKIARTLVAFSNTDGGKLLIGVKDNGVIAGVRSDEEYYMIEAAAQLYCHPEIQFKTYKWELSGKTVLEIIVPKSDKKPHYVAGQDGKKLSYIRVDDQNLLANKVMIKVWLNEKSKKGIFLKYSKNEKILLEYLQKNTNITISKYIRLALISRKDAENILADLVILNIIDIVITEKQTFYTLNKNFDKYLYDDYMGGNSE